ncbi:resolvase, partial [Campylobacter coli]|nr:resolvase [Campylobacter coli]ELE6086846.1 recombinase family protein [Campylobacter coli]
MNIAYIRVSTNKQELDSQKLEIMEYCHKNNIILDEILEVKISSTKSQEKRKIKDLKQRLQSGDLLIATELSRLGRSMLEIINLVL